MRYLGRNVGRLRGLGRSFVPIYPPPPPPDDWILISGIWEDPHTWHDEDVWIDSL